MFQGAIDASHLEERLGCVASHAEGSFHRKEGDSRTTGGLRVFTSDPGLRLTFEGYIDRANRLLGEKLPTRLYSYYGEM